MEPMAIMTKIGLVTGIICLLFSGCNQGGETTKTMAMSKSPQSVPAVPTQKVIAQPVDSRGRIEQLKKELCDDCGPESSQCEVEDLYEFPQTGKNPKRLIAFSAPGGRNASYTVVLSTKDACTTVLEESGTSINFGPKADKKQFPDIGLSSPWNVEESVETGYHWDGQGYVSEGSVKTNARTGVEEVLH